MDNDGDLDLVTNNLNSPALIQENTTNDSKNWLKIILNYKKGNQKGIGTKAYSYSNGVQQFKEMYTVRGFQSSSEPIIHFGYGEVEKIDSLKIVWPDKTYQILKNLNVNQTVIIEPVNNKPYFYKKAYTTNQLLFAKTTNNLGIDYIHVEDNYSDYLRQKLIPYQISDRGPAVSTGDLDGNGNDEIIASPGEGGGPQIRLYDKDGTLLNPGFFAFDETERNGLEISAADLDGDGHDEIIAIGSDVFTLSIF